MSRRAPDESAASGGLRLAFAALGVAFLASTLWILLDEHLSEWRGWQSRHAQLLARLDGGAPEDEASPRIQQIWLRELGRVDRCETCHLALRDTAFADVEQPLRPHGGDWLQTHPERRFGCTACHGGRGEATTVRGAHHPRSGRWSDALAGAGMLDAHCGRCHRGRNPARAPRLARGRRLIAESNCVGCHEIPGFGADDLRAPRLDGLGEKLRPGWLRAWLRDPERAQPGSRMPTFELTAQEVDDLAAFLLAPEGGSVPSRPPVDWERADAERGDALFRTARCVTCHAVDGRGGGVGPDLTRIGSKARRDWLYRWLEDPFRHQPDTLMPRFRFDAAERADLVAYLSADLVAEEPLVDPGPGRGSAEAGRALFLERGCAGCHARTGIAEAPRIGPALAEIDSRDFDPSALEARGIPPDLPNRIFAQVRAPTSLAEDARMPSFGFGEAEAAAVTLAVLSFAADPPPPPWLADEPPPQRVRPPQGEIGALFRRYRCLSCHRLGGRGRTLSTVDLDRIGSQLQRSHLESFLLRPYAIRVGLEARMPRLGLTEAEVRSLVEYIATQLLDDELDAAERGDPALGRELYGELGCQGCHSIAGRGGYVGPDLGDSGRRLRPGWIAAWLRDPERWKPGTLQPDYGLSGERARDLAAYLMTLTSPPSGTAP